MLSPPWTYPPPSCFAMTLNLPGTEGSLAMAAATLSMAATVSGSSASAAAFALCRRGLHSSRFAFSSVESRCFEMSPLNRRIHSQHLDGDVLTHRLHKHLV